jgi:glycosyltransferase involved in cell wall biosynthesis
MPKFSIVTIALNAEKHLRDTLSSVANQEFHNFEHIVWDGGSTDSTLDIVAQFPHIKLVQGSDSGISDAMNKGASHATGDYIIYLHADDYLAHPQVLVNLDSYLADAPAPWLYGRAEMVDEGGNLRRITNHIPWDPRRLRRYNIITHPATLIRRDLFEEVGGFDTSLKYAMDYDLWLRLSKKCDAISLPWILAAFRQHEGSLSTREERAVANEAYQVRNNYVESLLERLRSWRTWRRRVSKIML